MQMYDEQSSKLYEIATRAAHEIASEFVGRVADNTPDMERELQDAMRKAIADAVEQEFHTGVAKVMVHIIRATLLGATNAEELSRDFRDTLAK